MKKSIQKLLSLALMAICCLACLVCFVGCGKCEHYSKSFVEDTATCERAGVTRYKCNDCEAIVEEESKAKGHDYSVLTKDTATCMESGTKTYKCSKCSSTKNESSAKKSHKYSPAKCADCDAVNPDYDEDIVRYSDGTYTYRKSFKYIIGYTIYELSCGIKIKKGSTTAEFFISGSLKTFIGKGFGAAVVDDDNVRLGSLSTIITPASPIFLSHNIQLSKAIQEGDKCYFTIEELF